MILNEIREEELRRSFQKTKESFSGLEKKSKIIGKVYVCHFFLNKTLEIHMD